MNFCSSVPRKAFRPDKRVFVSEQEKHAQASSSKDEVVQKLMSDADKQPEAPGKLQDLINYEENNFQMHL